MGLEVKSPMDVIKGGDKTNTGKEGPTSSPNGVKQVFYQENVKTGDVSMKTPAMPEIKP